jgi:excisionase family DNA binding protein
MPAYSILSVDDVAERLKVSSRFVRRLCQTGRIGKALGGRYVISEDELREFKKNRRGPGRPRSNSVSP